MRAMIPSPDAWLGQPREQVVGFPSSADEQRDTCSFSTWIKVSQRPESTETKVRSTHLLYLVATAEFVCTLAVS